MSFSLDCFFSGKPSADTPPDPSHELPPDVETSLGLARLTVGLATAEQLDHIHCIIWKVMILLMISLHSQMNTSRQLQKMTNEEDLFQDSVHV